MKPLRITSRMAEIEAQYGKPLRDVLVDLYREAGTFEKVAEILGVPAGTAFYWMDRLEIPRKTWRFPDDTAATREG